MNNSHSEIGAKIRKIREEKKLTINQVAKETGFTASFISQFERGLTKASIASLRKIATCLGINLSTLFEDVDDKKESSQENEIIIVRKEKRKTLTYPDGKSKDYLLTNTTGTFEVIYSKIEPGGVSGELISHGSIEECITILKGKLLLTIGDEEYILNDGDTITFPSHIPHGWENIGDEVVEVIWVVAPPSY